MKKWISKTSSVQRKIGFFNKNDKSFEALHPVTMQKLNSPYKFDISKKEDLRLLFDLNDKLKSQNQNISTPLGALKTTRDNKGDLISNYLTAYELFTGGVSSKTIGSSNNLSAKIAFYLLNLPIHKKTFEFFIDHDIFCPINLIISRLWLSWQTSTGILGKGGEGLGKNFIGHADMMLGDDANSKMHIGTFTMNHRCVIYNPLQLIILDDLWVRTYTGGGNLKALTKDELGKLSTHKFRAGTTYDRGSWFAIAVPVGETVDDIIDVRGRFAKTDELQFTTTFTHYDMFKTITPNLNLYKDADPVENSYNSAMFQGTQRCYDFKEKCIDAYLLGLHHPLGVNIYSGCKQVLENRETVLKDQEYEKKSRYKIYYYNGL